MSFVNTVVGSRNPNTVWTAPLFMNANTATKSAIVTIVIPSSGVRTVIIAERAIISPTVCHVTNVSDASTSSINHTISSIAK